MIINGNVRLSPLPFFGGGGVVVVVVVVAITVNKNK